jgi:PAS domain S-box-containing protein
MPLKNPAAAAAADSDALFRAVADQAPVMLWMSGPDAGCTFFNTEWLTFTGRRLEEELGCGWLEGIHPADRDPFVAHARKAQKDLKPFSYEYRLRRADGRYRWMLGHGAPRMGPDGALLGYVGSCADITEREEADAAMRAAQRRLTTLIENAQDMIYRTRLVPTRVVELIAGAAEAITGHTAEEFYEDADLWLKAVHPDDQHLVAETLRDPARLKDAITLRWVHRDGRVVWAEHRRVPVVDADGNVVAIEGIARDSTTRIQTQQRLRESEEQLRQLAARLQSAREDERAMLARELHDELGQTLTAIKLELARATEELQRAQIGPKAVDRLQSLVGLTDIGITTVKRISTSLRPATLDHLGLAEAIRWEAMTFRARTGLRCNVPAEKDITVLNPEQQTMLFRIFQEALTNVVRHARASAVHVALTERANTFELRIRDNGIGITEAQARHPAAIGLLGMRERAALIGGTFAIEGRRGKGTVITVRLPIGAGGSRPPARPRAAKGAR